MSEWLLSRGIDWAERGLLPDWLLRLGIRRLLAERADAPEMHDCELRQLKMQSFLEDMSSGPIAPVPEQANAQHYEVPPEFFALVLGQHRKYSCCYWPTGVTTLDEAEAAALEVSCKRADLRDGQDVLELGCGWGSLSLWMAQRYPASRITAVSNSAPQRQYIEARAAERGLNNLRVLTADMNAFAPQKQFDRVVSVEMFEHMRNWPGLLERIAGWLRPGGKLFVHVFCHRACAYPYETEGTGNWLGRYFFAGGIMPSDDLLPHFQRHLHLKGKWRWGGEHYRRTAQGWLANQDARREQIMPVLERHYTPAEARRWFGRWRIFFLACEELFGYHGGQEWWVAHYLMEKPG